MANGIETLHEAMVVCMVREKRLSMSAVELSQLITDWDLWRRKKDGQSPAPWHVELRARSKACRWLFVVTGKKASAVVTIRCPEGPKQG